MARAPRPCYSQPANTGSLAIPGYMLVIEPQTQREVSGRKSQKDWSVEDLRPSPNYFTYPRQASPPRSLPQPWHSPGSLLMSLAGSLGAAGTLRLAFCSFQYSRQCRSWEWMKRHMSQAWATHTSSSMPSLWRGRKGSKGEVWVYSLLKQVWEKPGQVPVAPVACPPHSH